MSTYIVRIVVDHDAITPTKAEKRAIATHLRRAARRMDDASLPDGVLVRGIEVSEVIE